MIHKYLVPPSLSLILVETALAGTRGAYQIHTPVSSLLHGFKIAFWQTIAIHMLDTKSWEDAFHSIPFIAGSKSNLSEIFKNVQPKFPKKRAALDWQRNRPHHQLQKASQKKIGFARQVARFVMPQLHHFSSWKLPFTPKNWNEKHLVKGSCGAQTASVWPSEVEFIKFNGASRKMPKPTQAQTQPSVLFCQRCSNNTPIPSPQNNNKKHPAKTMIFFRTQNSINSPATLGSWHHNLRLLPLEAS